MKDEDKSKEQLLEELLELRQEVKELNKLAYKLNAFKLLYINTPIPYQSLDADGCLLHANQAWFDTLGYSEEEVVGRWFGDFLAPDYMPKFKQNFSRFKDEGETCVSLKMLRKDGAHLLVYFEGKASYDDNGNFKQIHCIFQDITDRSNYEEKLRQQQYYLEKAQNLGQIGTWEIDAIQNKIVWTDENCHIFGVPSGSIVSYEVFLEKVHPDDRGLVDQAWKAALEGKSYDIEHRIIVDGKTKWVLEKAEVDFDEKGQALKAIGITQDITERKQSEKSLKESEEKYRELVENANSMILRLLPDGTITFFNEFAQNFFGFSESEIIGKNVVGTIVPQTESTGRDLKQMVSDVLGAPAEYDKNDNENICKNGKRVWVSWKNRTIKDQNGNVIEILSVGTDMTERRQAEEDLINSHQKFQSMVDNIGIGVALISPEMKIIELNQKMREWFPNVNPGMHPLCYRVFNDPPRDKSCDYCPTIKTLQDGKAHESLTATPSAGGEINFRIISSPILNAQGQVTAAIEMVEDITEQRKNEVLLRQAQKMESIGTLAGGIAHDFNNILGGITGYTELSKDNIPKNSPVDDYLNNILTLTTRAGDLVSQILTFSRKTAYKLEPIDIVPVLKEVLKLICSTLPRTIEIEENINEAPAVVLGDLSNIHQIVMNLVTNAAQSMKGDTGIIKISLTSERLDEKGLDGDSNASPGMFVKLTVQDNGIGIDPSIINHIFDPFFSTKEVGKGTGLGLSVIYGIVISFGGLIKVNSVLNEGTTFNVFIPKTEMKVIETDAVSQQVIPGTANILFVDDEELLRDITQKTLLSLGFTVTAASDASEAIKIFEEDPEHFDLVITDLAMPKMTGLDLSKRLIKLRPEIPVILCSGNPGDISDQNIKDAGIHATFLKPISKVKLSKVIFDVLKTKEN